MTPEIENILSYLNEEDKIDLAKKLLEILKPGNKLKFDYGKENQYFSESIIDWSIK